MPHKLLLADDSITIQRVIELTFADEDVQVLAVGDGQKAIASIQSDRPDIVLADVGMPERDGYEVVEFIKSNPQFANIPVLLLTGAFEPIDESRARAAGCDGVLVKPFEPQMVINRVKDLLAGRRSGGLWGAKPTPAAPAPEAKPAPSPGTDVDSPPAAPGSASPASASLEDYFDRLDAAFASVEAATDAQVVATASPRPSNVAPAADVVSGSSSGLAKHDLEGWDPDLTGDPVRSGPIPAAVVTPSPAIPPRAPATVVPSATPIRFKPVTPASPESPVPATEPAPAPASPSPAASIPFAAPAPVPVPIEPPPAVVEAAPAPVLERRHPTVQPPAPPAPIATAPRVASASSSLPSLAEAFATLLSAEQGRSISPSKVGTSSVSDQTIDEIVTRVIARMTDQTVRETVIGVAERLVREEIERIKLGSR